MGCLFLDTGMVSKKYTIQLALLQEFQNEREEKLARHLLERIAPYVRRDKLQFVEWARIERENLKDAGKHYDSFSFPSRLVIVGT